MTILLFRGIYYLASIMASCIGHRLSKRGGSKILTVLRKQCSGQAGKEDFQSSASSLLTEETEASCLTPYSSSPNSSVDGDENEVSDADFDGRVDDDDVDIVCGMPYSYYLSNGHRHVNQEHHFQHGFYTGQIETSTKRPHGMGTWRCATGTKLIEGWWFEGRLRQSKHELSMPLGTIMEHGSSSQRPPVGHRRASAPEMSGKQVKLHRNNGQRRSSSQAAVRDSLRMVKDHLTQEHERERCTLEYDVVSRSTVDPPGSYTRRSSVKDVVETLPAVEALPADIPSFPLCRPCV